MSKITGWRKDCRKVYGRIGTGSDDLTGIQVLGYYIDLSCGHLTWEEVRPDIDSEYQCKECREEKEYTT